ncbi:TPA: hypothetical protein AB5E71_002376 [Vibrio cholerae]
MDDLIVSVTNKLDEFVRISLITFKDVKIEWLVIETPEIASKKFTNPSGNCIKLIVSNHKHEETYFFITHDHAIILYGNEERIERMISIFKLPDGGQSIFSPDFGQMFFVDELDSSVIHPIFIHAVSGFYFDMAFEMLYSSVYPEEQA